MPNIDSPLQEPHPRHASATIVTTEREYIPPKPPTRNILPRGSPHKRTPIGHRASGSAVWDHTWAAEILASSRAYLSAMCKIRCDSSENTANSQSCMKGGLPVDELQLKSRDSRKPTERNLLARWKFR